jgi:hypothetical protein
MKTVGFFLLAVLVIAARGGISDAFSAAVAPFPPTPMLPSSAASAPPMDMPAAKPGAPAGSSQNPKSTPVQVPAPTGHYAARPRIFPAMTFHTE